MGAGTFVALGDDVLCVCVHNIFRSTQSAKRLIIPLSNTISDIAYIVNKVLDEQHDHDDDVENERPKKKTKIVAS